MLGALWNEEIETLDPDAQRAMETGKLSRQLQYVYARSPFYQRKFRLSGLGPDDIGSAEDLSRLPFTTKAELRESQEREPPFGDYLAATQPTVARVHRTSGSTGRFLYTVLTRDDLRQTNECGARAFWAAGLRPHHTVVHCLNYCLWMGGYTDHSNLETTGATVLPYGVGNSRQLVRVIREVSVDVISCTPTYPAVLEDVVREELGVEPADLGLKLGLFGGEPAVENPEFRRRLEETWGLRAANANYGMSDVLCNFASVCDTVDELHFLAQGALVAQLVDPDSGEDLSVEEGAAGELVLTNLDREAQPLVRYRTGDMIRVAGTGPCRCRRTGFRFRVLGRSDDMLHVRGVNVFPSGIGHALSTLAPEVTGEFQVVLTQPGPYDLLDIDIEHGEHVRDQDMEPLRRLIETRLRELLTFRARVSLRPPGSIPRTEMEKAQRVVRSY